MHYLKEKSFLHTFKVINTRLNEIFVLRKKGKAPWGANQIRAPIEHALDELQRRVDRGPPLHTVADLRRALVREWNQIPQAFFRNLVESMRRRCLACIASNGGHTRY